jgi:hypothetical protein
VDCPLQRRVQCEPDTDDFSEDQRGPAYARYLRSAIANPDIVGCHWFQYVDEPLTGRVLDGENGHIGFVTAADIPYAGFVSAVRQVNLSLLETGGDNRKVLTAFAPWHSRRSVAFPTRLGRSRVPPQGSALGHEERFPPTRLSAGCGFRKEMIAGMRRNGRDAPTPDVHRTVVDSTSKIVSGHSPIRR